jgi:ABC-type sugar transport system, permease component
MNKQRMYRIVHYAVLILLSLATLLPVLWVVLSSFKPQSELFRVPLTFIPQDWTLENYVSSLAAGNFPVYFSNTVFVAVVSTAITVLINLMAGYALAKYIFKGRDIIFTVMIATLMIPLQVIMIPIFLQLKSLGMLNSLWGIIIPTGCHSYGSVPCPSVFGDATELADRSGPYRWGAGAHYFLPLDSPHEQAHCCHHCHFQLHVALERLLVAFDRHHRQPQADHPAGAGEFRRATADQLV